MDTPIETPKTIETVKTIQTSDLTFNKKYLFILLPFLLLGLLYWQLFSAPTDFPSRSIISVPQGTGLLKLSARLKSEGVVRSEFGFRTLAILFGGERGLQAGDYYLPHPENALSMARRIVKGDRGIASIRVTVPEGFTVRDINDLFDNRFPKFDHDLFLANAKEGYLFPDTYFVEISSSASSTLSLFKNNFEKKIEPLKPDIESSGRTLDQIIIMASILESEGKSDTDRREIAAILYRRIKIGIPLQVDASLKYINGKTSAEQTQGDLNTDSPYNTYKYRGLPPGPISNPGLGSIMAALHPATSTPYLYFLTGDDGQMYYAKTFADHIKNKAKYLKD